MEPTFDSDGYPTEETLQALRDWPYETLKDALPFLAKAWYYPDMAKETKPGVWVFATGGWSGNEELMSVFWSNKNTILLRWERLYVPGGLHIIALKEGEKKLDELFQTITEWAWSSNCKICGRKLNPNAGADDPALDCGGDCLACIKEAER